MPVYFEKYSKARQRSHNYFSEEETIVKSFCFITGRLGKLFVTPLFLPLKASNFYQTYFNIFTCNWYKKNISGVSEARGIFFVWYNVTPPFGVTLCYRCFSLVPDRILSLKHFHLAKRVLTTTKQKSLTTKQLFLTKKYFFCSFGSSFMFCSVFLCNKSRFVKKILLGISTF